MINRAKLSFGLRNQRRISSVRAALQGLITTSFSIAVGSPGQINGAHSAAPDLTHDFM
jgi:hypothetical protein